MSSDVVGALQVDAFMDDEVLPVFDLDQRMLAVGASALYREDPLTIAFVPVWDQFLIGPVLRVRLYHRKPVDLEFLVPGRMGIIERPLPERDISADNADQAEILLIKIIT